MKIYTGNAFGKKLDEVKKHDLGIMISSSPVTKPAKEFSQVFCALDNGAFPAWKKGYPFQENVFLKTLDECYRLGIPLDFIVCPDIVGGGQRSLEFSLEWAEGRLKTAPNLALVVQDDIYTRESICTLSSPITPEMLGHYDIERFSYIFVGGTPEWKWRTLPEWVSFCNDRKRACHVGQCGTFDRLKLCKSLKVTSVDSTSFTRNESWNIIEEFRGKDLFEHVASKSL